jgi:hypothetical protein
MLLCDGSGPAAGAEGYRRARVTEAIDCLPRAASLRSEVADLVGDVENEKQGKSRKDHFSCACQSKNCNGIHEHAQHSIFVQRRAPGHVYSHGSLKLLLSSRAA